MAGRSLPSGTVAFLFVDIEGSTALLRRVGSAYRDYLDQYRTLLLDAFEQHDGHPLGSEGDSLFVAFARASDALAAAVAGQLSLSAHRWPQDVQVRARTGIHVGEAERLGDGYVGMAIHLAARVCAAGHGGQILVTEAAHRLAPTFDVVDLGRYDLKDVGPTALLQVQHPGLARTFPPLRVGAHQATNLPPEEDRFVGRVAELEETADVLSIARLLTLSGPGGTGKTRLALELARRVLPNFADGVWFVPLAGRAAGESVEAVVAEVLGLRAAFDSGAGQVVEQWLSSRRTLLVLDNCEHIVDRVAAMVDRLLQRCPQLRVLATSRELLGLRAEHALRVPPLSLEGDERHGGTSDAVELLLARAQAMVPGFDPTMVDVEVAEQVCRRLDGLPLAIELAAARLRVLSMEQLASRLHDRFRLLTGGSRTALPRHQTLAAVVTWSYDLLLETDKQVFVRTSVFADDFTLEAAEAVVSGPPVDKVDVLDVLTRLIEKSLLLVVPSPDGHRYRLLETLQQYGQDRLVESGEVVAWRNRLLDWSLRQVAEVEGALRTPRQDAAIAAVVRDRRNHLASMTWARELGSHLDALRIVSAVPVGSAGERRALLETSLEDATAAGPLEDSIAGRAWSALANIAFEQADWQYGIEVSRRAAECFERAGRPRDVAWSRSIELMQHWGAGDDEVDRLHRTVLRLYQELDDDVGLGHALWIASMRTPDLAEAERLAIEADARLRRAGSPVGVAHNVEGRAIIAFDRGDLASAAEHVAEAIRLFTGAINYGCTAHALETAVAVLAHLPAPPDSPLAEVLTAAERLRRRSGQGHRPWEVRARRADVAALLDEIALRAGPAGAEPTLASAATLALEALEAARLKATARITEQQRLAEDGADGLGRHRHRLDTR